MKKKLLSHLEIVIAVAALVFLGILIFFYLWAIDAIVTQLHASLVNPTPQNVSGFDLKKASKLDLRGLLNQSSSTSLSETSTTP